MNILQIAPKVPYPLKDGGAIGIYNITKYLALRGHKITFVTMSDNSEQDYSEFEKYCSLKIVKKDTGNKISGIVQNILSDVPYTHSKYQSAEMLDVVDNELTREKYDIVHLDHLHMSYYGSYIKKNYNIPVVLREHNYETLIWERLKDREKNIIKKIFFSSQYSKIEKYEALECRKFDNCMMVTEADKKSLLQKDSSVPVSTIPAGVDLDYFSVTGGKIKQNSLLFIGSLDWFPNLDAFRWFYSDVFPEIKKRAPEVTLTVIGKNPPDEVKNIQDKNVRVLGMVDDVRPHFAEANVCVVPLRIGGGMRIKILEMLAMKKALVSTQIGAEGIDVLNGKHLLVADKPLMIADAVCRLFNDKSLCESLGEEGYRFVKENYSWEMIAEKIEQLYLKLIDEYNEKQKN